MNLQINVHRTFGIENIIDKKPKGVSCSEDGPHFRTLATKLVLRSRVPEEKNRHKHELTSKVHGIHE